MRKGKKVFLGLRFGDVLQHYFKLFCSIHSGHYSDLNLRSGGKDLRSSQVYPRSFGEWVARNHKIAT